jgi:hypothetical protein
VTTARDNGQRPAATKATRVNRKPSARTPTTNHAAARCLGGNARSRTSSDSFTTTGVPPRCDNQPKPNTALTVNRATVTLRLPLCPERVEFRYQRVKLPLNHAAVVVGRYGEFLYSVHDLQQSREVVGREGQRIRHGSEPRPQPRPATPGSGRVNGPVRRGRETVEQKALRLTAAMAQSESDGPHVRPYGCEAIA